jgi:hypothetical protein
MLVAINCYKIIISLSVQISIIIFYIIYNIAHTVHLSLYTPKKTAYFQNN